MRRTVVGFRLTVQNRANYNCSMFVKSMFAGPVNPEDPNLRHWGGSVSGPIRHLSNLVAHQYSMTASSMEQVNPPASAYHRHMKRDLPVTCCTECGGVGYNIRVANGRCSKTIGERRCSGVNAVAVKTLDWIECTHCEATGYYRNKECPKCKGAGYLFVGLRGKETVA